MTKAKLFWFLKRQDWSRLHWIPDQSSRTPIRVKDGEVEIPNNARH